LLNSLLLIIDAVAIGTKVDEDNVHWWQSRIQDKASQVYGMKGRNHIIFMLYDPLSDSSELNITFSHQPTHDG
jgi:hypothetical protein